MAFVTFTLVACGGNGTETSEPPTTQGETRTQNEPINEPISEAQKTQTEEPSQNDDDTNEPTANEEAPAYAATGELTLGDTFLVRDWQVTFHPNIQIHQIGSELFHGRDEERNRLYSDLVIQIPVTIENVSDHTNNSFRYVYTGSWGPHSVRLDRMWNNDVGFLQPVGDTTVRRHINPDFEWDWSTPVNEPVHTYMFIYHVGDGDYRLGMVMRGVAQADTAVHFTLENGVLVPSN